MEQGPQSLRESLRFAVGIYRSKALTLRGRIAREPMLRFETRAGRRDPYPIHEDFRSRGPIVTTYAGFLATADHALCRDLVRSRKFGVKDPDTGVTHGALYEGEGVIDRSMLGANAPEHTRLRRLAAPGFSPKLMRGYEEMIEKKVASLLDAAATRTSFDLVHDVAAPLPIAVITDLLGLPDADTAAFERYGETMASALDGIESLGHARRLMVADSKLERIFDRLFELRAREPRDDLVSVLVAARDDDRITSKELVSMCQVLLVAGFETTVNLISNAVLALHRTPGAWDRLVADPGLAGLAVEETLRFDPPVQRTIRVALEDTELGGRPIAKGTWVVALIGGANRDPSVYADPSSYVIDRFADPATPDHLAFSGGIHFCLGAPLARMEAAIALRALADRMPRLRLLDEPTMRRSVSVRGPASLPAAATGPDTGSPSRTGSMMCGVEILPADGTDSFVVRLSGMDQSHVDLADPTRIAFDYVRRMADVIDVHRPPRQPLRVVHVGGAGLTLPRYVCATRPTSWQVVLEPNGPLTELVRHQLPLPRRSGIKVREVDGRAGVAALRQDAAQLVVLDAFADARVPGDLVTVEFFADVARVLEGDGLMLLNLTERAPFPWTRRVVAGLSQSFGAMMLSAEPSTLRGRRWGNLLVVASRDDVPQAALKARATTSAAPYRVLDHALVRDTFGGGKPFTDADTERSPAPR